MKVKFTQDYEVNDGSGKVYKQGDVEDFVVPSARHFLNRGVAVEYVAPAAVKKVAAAIKTKPRGGTRPFNIPGAKK